MQEVSPLDPDQRVQASKAAGSPWQGKLPANRDDAGDAGEQAFQALDNSGLTKPTAPPTTKYKTETRYPGSSDEMGTQEMERSLQTHPPVTVIMKARQSTHDDTGADM